MSNITPVPAKQRLLSLDVFRGVTIAAMVVVNNPGDWKYIYAPLEHAEWNGCTPTDLIFPFFLFIVGVSIVYAMESKKTNPANHLKLILQGFRRMVTLILISWAVQLFYHADLSHLRFPGVLPRIGVVFFICMLLYLKTTPRVWDWVLAIALVGYYLLMSFVPVPDGTAPNLEPGTNLAAWFDRLVFTTNHVWRQSKTWDPEGLLSTLPAIGTGILGVRVGHWLKRKDVDDGNKISWLFTYGVLTLVCGMIWGLFFPLNKALWTSSFVLYAGGWAMLALAFSYWVIDVKGYTRFTFPFKVLGVNAIAAYVLSGILQGLIDFIKVTDAQGEKVKATVWFYQNCISPYFSPINASLARALLYTLIVWLVMYIFYRKKIYIKV